MKKYVKKLCFSFMAVVLLLCFGCGKEKETIVIHDTVPSSSEPSLAGTEWICYDGNYHDGASIQFISEKVMTFTGWDADEEYCEYDGRFLYSYKSTNNVFKINELEDTQMTYPIAEFSIIEPDTILIILNGDSFLIYRIK